MPGFDYGRASFDVHNRFVLLGSISAPWQLLFAPFLSVNSGTPYNITTGTDLTGNNQFNARPTFAASCSQPNAIATPYGCLDPDPQTSPSGASERIIPHNLGTGPSQCEPESAHQQGDWIWPTGRQAEAGVADHAAGRAAADSGAEA